LKPALNQNDFDLEAKNGSEIAVGGLFSLSIEGLIYDDYSFRPDRDRVIVKLNETALQATLPSCRPKSEPKVTAEQFGIGDLGHS